MENNMIELRKKLEQMTKEQLTGILQTETEKETPDDDLVLLILDILEKRDASRPVELGWKGKAAWREYLAKARKRVRPASYWCRRIAAAAASLVLVLMLVFAALPQEAKAGGIFDVIGKYTEFVLRFFSPGNEVEPLVYEFKTENPGLQKLRDTVVEYGVTGPAVPMWIPEEYDELLVFEIDETDEYTSVSTVITDGDKNLVIKISIYNTVEPRGVYKNLPDPQELEFFGITHYYVNNLERYTSVWERDNMAGYITLDCQEDTLKKILKSIYVMEAV